MRLERDEASDRAVLVLDESFPSAVAGTYRCGPRPGDGYVALHFDGRERLLGVTVEKASAHLPRELRTAGPGPLEPSVSVDEGAGYLGLGRPAGTLSTHAVDAAEAMVFVDFNADGSLAGIESLAPRTTFPPAVLERARP